MSWRTRRRIVARVDQRARRNRTHIVGADVGETWVRAANGAGPGSGNQRRAGGNPVVGTGAYSTCNPSRASLKHHLVNRRAAHAEKHVVVHLQALYSFEGFNGRTDLSLP